MALGAISYGVYLFHWPIFLAIDERTGLPIGALFAVRVAVTLAVAVLSFVLLERPIRTAASSGWVTARAGLVGAAAVALAIAVVPLGRQLATSSGDGRGRRSGRRRWPSSRRPRRRPPPRGRAVVETATPLRSASTTVAPPIDRADSLPGRPDTSGPRPHRRRLDGDGHGGRHGRSGPGIIGTSPRSSVVAGPGCGFVRAGKITDDFDDTVGRLHGAVRRGTAGDGRRSGAGRRAGDGDVDATSSIASGSRAREPLVATDDLFVDRLTAEYTSATQRLLDEGVGKVLWVAPPTPDLPPTVRCSGALDPLIRAALSRRCWLSWSRRFPGPVPSSSTWRRGWASTTDPPDRRTVLPTPRPAPCELADRYLGPVVVAEAAL